MNQEPMEYTDREKDMRLRALMVAGMLDETQRELVKIQHEIDAAFMGVVKAIGVLTGLEPIECGE